MCTSRANYIRKETRILHGVCSTCGTSRITRTVSGAFITEVTNSEQQRRAKRHKHLGNKFDKGEYMIRETTYCNIFHQSMTEIRQ
jgi:hypothetical protein